MKIVDDGVGFNDEIQSSGIKGMGLRNMEERIASHDGTFKLTENKPSGLTLEVFLKGQKRQKKAD